MVPGLLELLRDGDGAGGEAAYGLPRHPPWPRSSTSVAGLRWPGRVPPASTAATCLSNDSGPLLSKVGPRSPRFFTTLPSQAPPAFCECASAVGYTYAATASGSAPRRVIIC